MLFSLFSFSLLFSLPTQSNSNSIESNYYEGTEFRVVNSARLIRQAFMAETHRIYIYSQLAR